MLQTLKDLDRETAAIRTRAHKFGVAKDQAWSASERLKNLEAALAQPPQDITTLQEILALAKQMPSGLVTRGTPLQPGGANLQMLIIREVEGAIRVLADQRKALEDSLPGARERAAAAAARLAEFQD